jgi:hypothetical protein
VIAHDVEHHLQLLRAHGLGEASEVQPLARQVLVQFVEVHAPVAVVAGLAPVGQDAAPTGGFAAGEMLVRLVHDWCDPHRREAHVADVGGVVQDAFEVAAQVADIVSFAVRSGNALIEGRIVATLVTLIVGRIAVSKAVGQHEINCFAGEGLGRAVEFVGGQRFTSQQSQHDSGGEAAGHDGFKAPNPARHAARESFADVILIVAPKPQQTHLTTSHHA